MRFYFSFRTPGERVKDANRDDSRQSYTSNSSACAATRAANRAADLVKHSTTEQSCSFV